MSALTDRTTDKLGTACLALAGGSILASIATWARTRSDDPTAAAHAERFGIFVGLWAPTFIILGDYIHRLGRAQS